MNLPQTTLRRLLKVRKALGRDMDQAEWILLGLWGIEQRNREMMIDRDIRRAIAENEEVWWDYKAKEIVDLKI